MLGLIPSHSPKEKLMSLMRYNTGFLKKLSDLAMNS